MFVGRASSDLHLSVTTAEYVFEALAVLRQDAEARGGTTVLCGDILNVAETVPAEVFVRLRRLLMEWPGDAVVVIPGNHDQYDRQGNTILEALITPKCAVCPRPTWNEMGLCMPYTPQDNFWDAVKSAKQWAKPKCSIWWTHQGWVGAYMNTMRRDKDGLPVSQVEAELVVSGHYHMPHGVGPVLYCGSPYQTSFAEEGQEKSYLAWDGSGIWPNRVPFHLGAPRHFTVRWEPEHGAPEPPAGIRPQDRVRVVTTADKATAKSAAAQLAAAGLDGVPLLVQPSMQSAAVDPSGGPWSAVERWLAARAGQEPRALGPGEVVEYARGAGLWGG